MKVHIVGGGPAGLYFAIMMKKAWPQTRITVFERNRPDDTFGFGVVFSDQTLDTFETYDRDSYRAIIGHFAYWDDIEIHFRGTTHRIGGNGFCGCSRATLLKILGRRARALGVEIKYQTEVSPLDEAIREHLGCKERHQPHHGAHAEGHVLPVHPEVVVVEAVLLVPEAGAAQVVHRVDDGDEVLEELRGDIGVYRLVNRELERDRQHRRAIERHPRGAVGLLELLA